MLDATATENFSLDDLAAAEALWGKPAADPTADPKPAKSRRASPGRQNPNWKPRKKGEKRDYESAEYQQELEDASRGLPQFHVLQWVQAQLHDGGVRRGRSQFSVKLEFSDAPIQHCTRTGLIAMKRTRWASLSMLSNFRTNLRRKKIDPRTFDQHDRDNGEKMLAVAQQADQTNSGAPPCLLGLVSNTFEGKGTITFGSQHVLLYWHHTAEEPDVWNPGLIITRRLADGMEFVSFDLHDYPLINRDGKPRQPSAFLFRGAWFSPALQERITAVGEIKAMKAADMKARA